MPDKGAGDWASDIADRLEHLVTTVREQTTDRVVSIARLVVFGLLAGIMGIMAGLLVVIALLRALNQIPPHKVWLTYLVLGAIFTVAGLFLWSKKDRRPAA